MQREPHYNERKRPVLRRCCYCNCYAAIASPTSSFATIATTNALSILRVPGDTATLKLLLLTSFAAVATAFAYADASVARVALLAAFKRIYICYCNCCAAIDTPTSIFDIMVTANALSILSVERDTATLKLLLLTSFAAVPTTIAYADASVVRVALLTAFKLICSCYCKCCAEIATPTSSFPTIVTTNALSLVRVPRQTATLPLRLLTSIISCCCSNCCKTG